MRPEHWLYTIPLRLRSLFRRAQTDQGLDDELRDHLELKVEEYVATGMRQSEALRRARFDLDGFEQTKEKCRDERRVRWIEDLIQDLQYGVRMLGKSPGFTAVVILTLTLGIGANTALFTVVNSILLNPLAYPHPDELTAIAQLETGGGATYPNFLDWRKENRSFSQMGAYAEHDFNLTSGGEAEKLRGQMISADFFPMLGVKPLLGRTFRDEEDRLGANPVVLLGKDFWTRSFGSSSGVLGEGITLYGKTYTIVGVVEENAPFFRTSDVFVPIGAWDDPTLHDRRVSVGMRVIGRLKPGISLKQAQADMNLLAKSMEVEYPEADKGVGVSIVPLKESIVGDARRILLLMLGAVGFVLLIACANVAGLLLARSQARTREFAVRVSMGATRMRIIRQLLTESVFLATVGGGSGLLLAAWCTKAILVEVLPEGLPRADNIHLDARIVFFTVAVCGVTGLLFGLIPALNTSRTDLVETFKEGGRGSSAIRHRAQGVFVMIEVAVALVLLTGAGLMLRSLNKLWNVDPGFDPHQVLFFNVSPSPERLRSSPAHILQTFRELPRQFENVPGVEAAAALFGSLPMQGESAVPVWIVGQVHPTNESEMNHAMIYGVTHDYWKVMRIPLLRGRYLTERDNENTPPVVVIDEALARSFFGDQDCLGMKLHVGLLDTEPEIIGIVKHVKHEGLASDGREKTPAQFYMPFMQVPPKFVSEVSLGVDFVVRTDGPPMSYVGAIRDASKQFDSQQVVYAFDSLDAIVSNSISSQQFLMRLLSGFAALALLLSCIGIYGLVSYLVEQRTHEIGVRIALGALRRDVLGLVLERGTTTTLFGIGIGLVGAFGLTRLLSGFLYGVTAVDLVTFGGMAMLVLLVGLLASYILRDVPHALTPWSLCAMNKSLRIARG